MKASELRTKTRKELEDKCTDLRKELFMLRMRRSGGQETKTHLLGQLKKSLAQVKTILREQERSDA